MDWSSIYYRFIKNKTYYNYISVTNNDSIKFSLFDTDTDGIPELIAVNIDDFSYAKQAYGYDIFIIKNGSVSRFAHTYLRGAFGAYSGSYAYPGAFGAFYDSYNSAVFNYYYIKNGTMYDEYVAAFPGTNTLKRQTSDVDLYNAFLSATKKTSVVFNNTTYTDYPFRYNAGYYNYSEITNMGWNTYLTKNPFLRVPKMSAVTNVYGGVKTDWIATPGAEKYRVFRKTGSGSWANLADTTATTYTDKSLQLCRQVSFCRRFLLYLRRTVGSQVDHLRRCAEAGDRGLAEQDEHHARRR